MVRCRLVDDTSMPVSIASSATHPHPTVNATNTENNSLLLKPRVPGCFLVGGLCSGGETPMLLYPRHMLDQLHSLLLRQVSWPISTLLITDS